MPQLDTSTWFMTILSMILTLFILFQSKFLSQIYPLDPSAKNVKSFEFKSPWENKWTKIYLPLSMPQQ